MLSYKLAKQLKKAGFYQNTGQHFGEDKELCFVKDYKNCTACPNLSELIEACRGNFMQLAKGNCPIDNKWTAQGYPIETMFAGGNTPEEAVAKLWLRIQRSNFLLRLFK